MKRVVIGFLLLMGAGLFLCPVAGAQTPIKTQGLSSRSAMLLQAVKDKYDVAQLVREYGLVEVDGVFYVQGIGSLNSGVDERQLASYGARVVSSTGTMKRIDVELESYADFAAAGLCEYFDIGGKVTPRVDYARGLTMASLAHRGVNLPHGYDGSGVVVGVIDGGFQPDHPTYRDTTGTQLRIKRMWYQDAYGSSHPQGYNYGVEYATPEAILNAPVDDQDYHGTHTSSTAAGTGYSDSAGIRYRGIAYGADIILVNYNFGPEAEIFDGIKYIRDNASAMQKPCVINMSLGSEIGPRDGTSAFDRMCDEYLTSRPDSCILVGSASNDADFHNHLEKTFAESDTMVKTIYYTMYPYCMDIWSDSLSTFSAQVSLVRRSDGMVVDSTGFIPVDSMEVVRHWLEIPSSSHLDIQIASTYSPYNKCRNMFIQVLEDIGYYESQNYHVVLTLKGRPGNHVHAWANYMAYFNGDETIGAVAGDSDYTVNELGGTGKHVITVGSYNSRCFLDNVMVSPPLTYWLLINEEELSDYSSRGPTVDGRTKPEVAAPGQYINAAYNKNYPLLNQEFPCEKVVVDGEEHYFGSMRGTSASTPVVTGIIALWLQHNPSLNYDSAVALIKAGSFTDSCTGVIPAEGSNLWGWGKINAYVGLPGATPQRCHVVLQSNDTSQGGVSGSGYYPIGESHVIRARGYSRRGYHFSHWSDGSTESIRMLTVTTDTMLIAYYTFDTTSITDIPQLKPVQVTMCGAVCMVEGLTGEEVTVYDVKGVLVSKGRGNGIYRLPAAGVYFVVAEGWKPTKVVVIRN